MPDPRSSWNLSALARKLGWRREEMPDVPRAVQLVHLVGESEGLPSPLLTPRASVGYRLGAQGANTFNVFRLKVLSEGGARVRGTWSAPVVGTAPRLTKTIWAPGVTPVLTIIPAAGSPPTWRNYDGGANGEGMKSIPTVGHVAGVFSNDDIPSMIGRQFNELDQYLAAGQTLELVNAVSNQAAAWDLTVTEYQAAPFAS